MITTKRQYFMTLAQLEQAVLTGITLSVADYNTLVAALTGAITTAQTRFPTATLHFGVYMYATLAGQQLMQLDIYHGEASTLNHWDLSLTVNLNNSNGSWVADVSTITVYDYGVQASALGA